MSKTATLSIALVGNPNTGKSTLFNALSGMRQRVGNYPGVTVEMKKGRTRLGEIEFELLDLPGTYSLAARSPDEMVAVDLLLGHLPEEPRPDVILSIVDATNLERHLYLTTQLMELGRPVVLAVNMTDVAEQRGITIDYARLAERLGVRVVPVQANKRKGLDKLKQALSEAAEEAESVQGPPFPEAFDAEVTHLRETLNGDVESFLIRRLLLDVGGAAEERLRPRLGAGASEMLTESRQRLRDAGCPVPAVEARARYGWIRERLNECITRPDVSPRTWRDRLDGVLTHKFWGTLIFLVLMFIVFQMIFTWAGPLMDGIDGGRSWLAEQLEDRMDPGPFRSLLVDGVLNGVGGVLIFLPQILLLFGFIAVLEDCGYMARAAFLMDRVMSRCGLNGKSFIPLMSSVACAVPGVMATRVIENRRDRLATILVAPLMSCSARLPVYLLLIAAFFSDPWWLPGLVLFGMYMIGFVTAPVVALLLKRSLLRGAPPLFVMELPAFKMPMPGAVVRRMVEAGWAFIRRAGTLILASMIVVWALLYFPEGPAVEREVAQLEAAGATEEEINAVQGDRQRNSFLGRLGRSLEPVFEPLGWDWKIGTAALASFPAREVVVGTLGILYNQGDVDPGAVEDPDDPEGGRLRDAVRDDWEREGAPFAGYGMATALSLMVFFALCCQCVSTLAVIRRETRSWSWPIFTFVYMTVLAYFAAMVTFQIARTITDWTT